MPLFPYLLSVFSSLANDFHPPENEHFQSPGVLCMARGIQNCNEYSNNTRVELTEQICEPTSIEISAPVVENESDDEVMADNEHAPVVENEPDNEVMAENEFTVGEVIIDNSLDESFDAKRTTNKS